MAYTITSPNYKVCQTTVLQDTGEYLPHQGNYATYDPGYSTCVVADFGDGLLMTVFTVSERGHGA